jgi:hypothetical protein
MEPLLKPRVNDFKAQGISPPNIMLPPKKSLGTAQDILYFFFFCGSGV